MSAVDYLRGLGACEGAMEWVLSRPKKRQSLKALWEDCERPDWMLWLAARQPNPDLAGIVAAAHAFAMLAHDYAADADAAADASNAADAADAYAATYAAYAASYAAAYAADAVAYAVVAAAPPAAAYAAADAISAARSLCRRQCADMVRLLVRCPEIPR